MNHILNEKKSAQIRLKIAPIARTTSRVGQIWSQIVFLIFLKKKSAAYSLISTLLSHKYGSMKKHMQRMIGS